MSLIGEHCEVQPATLNDLQLVMSSLHQCLDNDLEHHAQNTHVFPTSAPGTINPAAPSPPLSIPHVPCRGEHSSSLLSSRWRVYTPAATAAQRVTISEASQLSVNALPAGLCIPAVPKDVKLEEGWKWWVKDWENADPHWGLEKPLCEWKKEYYSGQNHVKFGVKYGQQKRVALEYIQG